MGDPFAAGPDKGQITKGTREGGFRSRRDPGGFKTAGSRFFALWGRKA